MKEELEKKAVSKTEWSDLKHTDRIHCTVCSGEVPVPPSHAARRKTCSETCMRVYREKFQISADHLLLDVWGRPVTDIAAELGVSDKAISKRCQRMNVPKPPRGYWAIVKTGVDHKKALRSLGWQPEEIDELDARIMVAENAIQALMNTEDKKGEGRLT